MTKTITLDYDYNTKVRHPGTGFAAVAAVLDAGRATYRETLRRFPDPDSLVRSIGRNADPAAPQEPQWVNNWLPGLDSLSIYGLLASHNPPTYLEVGSGHSTRFARRAIRDHNLRTRIVSIDPCPRAEIDLLCDEVIRSPLEDVDPAAYTELAPGSVVFIDSSHRSFQNSDVTVCFLELMPAMPEGVVLGLHDIVLPLDYPEDWVAEGRFYNEQYLLAAFLLGGHRGWEVILPCRHVFNHLADYPEYASTAALFQAQGIPHWGAAFWLRRLAG